MVFFDERTRFRAFANDSDADSRRAIIHFSVSAQLAVVSAQRVGWVREDAAPLFGAIPDALPASGQADGPVKCEIAFRRC